MQGTVVLYLVVTAEGQASNLKVLRPLGFGLDQSAIRCVNAWIFKPGMKEGNPVPVAATIQVNFRMLMDVREWRLRLASFTTPSGVSRPEIVKAKFPKLSDEPEQAKVTVSLDVDENGKPNNIRTERSSDPKWEAEVIAEVRNWKFTPAVKDGQPVLVHGILDFVRGAD
jgi:TonB family protein